MSKPQHQDSNSSVVPEKLRNFAEYIVKNRTKIGDNLKREIDDFRNANRAIFYEKVDGDDYLPHFFLRRGIDSAAVLLSGNHYDFYNNAKGNGGDTLLHIVVKRNLDGYYQGEEYQKKLLSTLLKYGMVFSSGIKDDQGKRPEDYSEFVRPLLENKNVGMSGAEIKALSRIQQEEIKEEEDFNTEGDGFPTGVATKLSDLQQIESRSPTHSLQTSR